MCLRMCVYLFHFHYRVSCAHTPTQTHTNLLNMVLVLVYVPVDILANRGRWWIIVRVSNKSFTDLPIPHQNRSARNRFVFPTGDLNFDIRCNMVYDPFRRYMEFHLWQSIHMQAFDMPNISVHNAMFRCLYCVAANVDSIRTG